MPYYVEPIEPEAAPAAPTRRMSRRPKKADETGQPLRDEEGQRRAMFAAFRDAGYVDEHTEEGRVARLHFCSEVAGREIETSNDLTWDEISNIIDALKLGLTTDDTTLPDAFPEES